MQFGCLERPLNRLFYRYGLFIADHPYWFLVVPLLVTAGLAPGFLFYNLSGDVEELYVPTNAPSLSDRNVTWRLFLEYPHTDYDPLRSTVPSAHGLVLVTSSTDGGNVLSPSNRVAVRRLDALIRNMTSQHDGAQYRYADLCARRDGECWSDAILALPSDGLRYPTHSVNGLSFTLVDVIGGVSLTDAGVVTAAEAWQLLYPLHPHEDASAAWQNGFIELIEATRLPGLSLAIYTANTVTDELQENVKSSMLRFVITFAVLTTFGVLTCWSADSVVSKPWLGMLGVLSAILAVVSSFGLLMYSGMDFIDIVSIGPFLVIGKVSRFR